MSESKRVGKEIVERLARFVDSLPVDEAGPLQPRSGPMDGPARKAERYAHGSEVIAELRARATQMRDRAAKDAKYQLKVGGGNAYCQMAQRELAASEMLAWLDDLGGCDAEIQHEGTKPSS